MDNKIKKKYLSTKRYRRENSGAAVAEAIFAIPIVLTLFFGCWELARAQYVSNCCAVSAQSVANSIAQNTTTNGPITISSFSTYASQWRFDGAVMENGQFSYDVLDSNNTTTVVGGIADGTMSSKVSVTVNFPPPSFPDYKIPTFDPGALYGGMMFPTGGLTLMSTAYAFLELSTRPTL